MLFSKTKSAPPKPKSEPVPIPDLPDLPSPGARKAAEPAAAAPAAAARKATSVLSADLTFEGNVSGSGDLQVDGRIKGDVRVGRLVVGETGAVDGAVQGDLVEVRGRVVGSVTGKQVKLMSTAYVDGDVTHEQLSIEVGAYFQGRCIQGGGQAANQVPPPAAQPAGFATPTAAPAPDGAQLIELKPTA